MRGCHVAVKVVPLFPLPYFMWFAPCISNDRLHPPEDPLVYVSPPTRQPFPRTHGHAMVLRWKRTLALTEWQQQQCHKSGKGREECIKRRERENFCWEKFPFMVEPGWRSVVGTGGTGGTGGTSWGLGVVEGSKFHIGWRLVDGWFAGYWM